MSVFDDLKKRIFHAATKHPGPFSMEQRLEALRAEVAELEQEIFLLPEGLSASVPGRVYDEALDVATVALRIAGHSTGLATFEIVKSEQDLLATMFENLTATQARCTELLEENRRLKKLCPAEESGS